ncbi:MAG TPA: excinuclease ABC subunit UvrC [Bacteroidales bacterium]|nr:excinuclease ABC subunit C [Bacteroidales bacterium]HNR41306.1 excinuclease ABC subunit UvrC [Bacteroidales bacterium]HPM18347.1 excinuclease ABC subunit UvrC [Bacteroidales bacterium]HQG75999.1 excinuclease ABC subunit UvrC [Bacteroidales bacterium]
MSVKTKHKEIISSLPDKPGVYQFLDATGKIIYVGKAKNLKKRVSSYFAGSQSGKTTVMLGKAESLSHIVVENESDALLLENNLIKKHQPRYNILLKDDKTFPWICIKNEPFPRVFSTRNVIKDGSVYFGPYTSALMVKTLLTLIRQLYKLRTCRYNLTETNIKAGKFKVCLEYHLGNCKAPCVGFQTEPDYRESIVQIRDILKGHIIAVTDHLKNKMNEYSNQLKFEEAQIIKEKIEILNKFRSHSAVVSNKIKNIDVFAITQDGDKFYVNYLKVVEGAVIQSYTLELRMQVTEEKESLLGYAITEIRQRYSSDSPEIIVPFKPDIEMEGIRYTIPKMGEKLKLLQLAERNAIYHKLEKKRRTAEIRSENRPGKNLEKVKRDLHLPSLPVHIECFDNSNIGGSSPVAACVVFRNGRPCNREYRHFNIKTVTGANDFLSMEEIVFRRYRRMLDENQNLPQLVIIDGGKGQLSSAMKSIEHLGLKEKITVIGIAKKLEEIYFPGDSVPIYLDKNSYTLKLIQQLRNEAHRFGINFHRHKRSSEMLKSKFDDIKGLGPKTKEKLLKNFDSVEKLRMANRNELDRIIGKNKASILLKYLENEPAVTPEAQLP